MSKINIFKKYNLEKDFKNISLSKIGFINFYIGITFFSSALPIGLFFLLISIIISVYINKNNYFRESWNIPFIITLILILLSSIRNYFLDSNYIDLGIEKYLMWVDFLKWLIFFTGFWSFQFYLKTVKDRYRFAKFFVISLSPVLFSCILQEWFNIYGPFSLFDNLIIWFQRPILHWDGRLTGLFNNPNYTGIWLAINFPFIILFIKKTKNLKKLFLYLLLLLNAYFFFQTGSRNAILSLIFSLSFITPLKILLCFLVILIMILIGIQLNLFSSFLFIETSILNNLKSFLVKILHPHLFDFSNHIRFNLWKDILNMIFKKPIFGWGAATFPIIYLFQKEQIEILWKPQHTHNIVFEIAYNYGLIVALLLSTTILFLFISAYRKIFNGINYYNENFIDKIWFSSAFLIIFSQLADITYFDGRFSILIWILLSGLKCTLDEKDRKYN